MLDLIYPMDPVRLLPSPTAENTGASSCEKEMFPVIDENGAVIGKAARSYCHSGAKVLHPVIHLHIINREGFLYLQKRSLKKDIQPGRWDTAVGGHVDFGEHIIEALYREAGEELGLTDFNPVYIKSYVFESSIEKEMVNVFVTIGNFSLSPDNEEVEEGRWWSRSEIEESLGKSVFTPNFEQEFGQIKAGLYSLL